MNITDKIRQNEPKKGKRARQLEFLAAFVAHDYNISATCSDVRIHRSTFYEWMKTARFRREVEDLVEAIGDEIETEILKKCRDGDTTMLIFFAKTKLKSRGYVEGHKEYASAKSQRATAILDKLLAGEVGVTAAALQFEIERLPMPRTLEIMLRREPPPEPNQPEWALPSDDELEARFQAGLDAADREETEFVPERTAEVQKMKDEHNDRDSYSPEAQKKLYQQ
jgi:hypothetical protein